MIWRIVNFFNKVRRAITFFKLGYQTYNDDYSSLLELEIRQMELMFASFNSYDCMVNWDHHKEHNNCDPVKALRIAIRLAKRIYRDDYTSNVNQHRKIYPRMHMIDTQPNADGHYPVKWNREYLPGERQSLIEASKNDERHRMRDIGLYNKIRTKYLMYWWQ